MDTIKQFREQVQETLRAWETTVICRICHASGYGIPSSISIPIIFLARTAHYTVPTRYCGNAGTHLVHQA